MFLQLQKEGKNDWWRWVIVVLFVVIGTFLGQVPLMIAGYVSGSHIGMDMNEVNYYLAENNLEAVGLHQNLALFLLILGFAGGLLGLWFGLRFIHERKFLSIITPFEKINWQKVLFSFGLWMGLTILIEVVFFLASPDTYSINFQPGKFIGLLLVSLLFLPIQTSFEELFFRGYLMQGIAQWAPFRLIPLIITSVLFGSLHFMNPEVQAFGVGVTMAYYIGVGLFLGIITLMDDSLELALGIHAATNIFGALFVTFDDSVLPTAAIFHTSEVNMSLMLGGLVVAAAIFTFVVSRKYGWQDWSRFYGKTQRPHLNEV
jgi:membrane protease YdiL (CAAX protease family)